ncbi:MAG: peroxiredoxin [Candidatus Babeliales bacterium]
MRKFNILFFFLFNIGFMNAALKIGTLAPDFKLKDEQGVTRSLSSFHGNKVALVFYPKNDSYYCTKEACSLREGFSLFKKNNIIVLGISYADPSENKAFKEKHALPFTLLSDTKKKVSKLYDTYIWWSLGFFPKRRTFLIDEHGILVGILDDVDVERHAQQIINTFISFSA